MKTLRRRQRIKSIPTGRWAAYAAAGAASAFTFAHAAEAEVHYSGVLKQAFRGQQDTSAATFPLDQDVRLHLIHQNVHGSLEGGGFAICKIEGGGIGGYSGWGFAGTSIYVSNLSRGVNLSDREFYADCVSSTSGIFCYYDFIGSARGYYGHFKERGSGYLGFRFDRGDGYQYGWARIVTTGDPDYKFILVDYAWADPGEPLRTGQKQSETGPKPGQKKRDAVPVSGSLGLIALGGAGLMAWRKNRSARDALRSERTESASRER